MSWTRRAANLVALAAIFPLLVVPSASASHESGQLEETRRQIRSSRSRLAAAARTDAQLQAVIDTLTAQLRRHQAGLAVAQANFGRVDALIRGEERRLSELGKEQRTRSEIVAERARALYMLGPGSAFEVLATAETLEEFLGRAGMVEQVLSFDRAVLEELATIQDRVRRTRAVLARRRTDAKRVRAEVAERVTLVGEIVQAKQEAHGALERRIAEEREVLQALEREQARILAIIRSRQSKGTGPVSRKGFVWPIRGPITSPYGPRGGEFHTGIDIDCETGDPIASSKAGRVIASEWGGGYGNMVIIDHGNGVATLYAHMSRRYVSDGQRVDQRQRVGACGSTGRSTGDHLHFEVRVNGEHRNPRDFLP